MKKSFQFISALFVFCFIMLFYSNTAMAAEEQSLTIEKEYLVGKEDFVKRELVETGYTEDGIYYEVYDVYEATPKLNSKTPDVTINSVISIDVFRSVVYMAIIPESSLPRSIHWTEQLDSYTTLSGTLSYWGCIHSYSPYKTEAIYKGTLVGRV